jgi:hypothetical protein
MVTVFSLSFSAGVGPSRSPEVAARGRVICRPAAAPPISPEAISLRRYSLNMCQIARGAINRGPKAVLQDLHDPTASGSCHSTLASTIKLLAASSVIGCSLSLDAYLRSRDVDVGVLTAAREVWDRYHEAVTVRNPAGELVWVRGVPAIPRRSPRAPSSPDPHRIRDDHEKRWRGRGNLPYAPPSSVGWQLHL